ncbi:MFS general substrate transporter [Hypoxylon trugodes]|uniref:MFS general substrate transporter n=1 Tax=Hypoxylon trugodes TaxID=326681 RepID=UPI00219C631C|nr:MFS general substrate transporter [Hypoxylon trugodes]KAI1384940.1 MFS general substrate transporter [Hypoxylon trugodes]
MSDSRPPLGIRNADSIRISGPEFAAQGPDPDFNVKDLEKYLTQDGVITNDPDLGTTGAIDSYLVTWDSPEDPANPFNWPQWMKWAVTLLTSLGGMVTLMSSTMMAPALPAISQDLHTDDARTQLTLSIFVLSFAFGPMALAPMTEVFGRKPVWLSSCCFYILWNTVSGFSQTNEVMIASRFFAGLGGSVQYAIENPVLADCWRPEQRGLSFAIATFLPLFGPALGPIIGGLLTGSVGWRWLFWVLSIFDALLMVLAFFIFPETHADTILHRKAKKLRKRTGHAYYTEHERGGKSLSRVLAVSLVRPCRLLVTQPLIQLMSFYLAYNYGILYIVQSTFATLWIEHYNQSVSVSGLHYIAIAVGCIIAAQVGARVTDRLWQHLQVRAKGETQPEYRVPLMIPGAITIPIGLFMYGWTAQVGAFWILPDIGIAIFSCGIILGTQAMQAYVMDSYPKHVASASAASQLLRNVAGFAFPLFAPKMYQTLGYGWGNSLLAFVFLGVGLPAPLILWKYGAKLRAKGGPQI